MNKGKGVGCGEAKKEGVSSYRNQLLSPVGVYAEIYAAFPLIKKTAERKENYFQKSTAAGKNDFSAVCVKLTFPKAHREFKMLTVKAARGGR